VAPEPNQVETLATFTAALKDARGAADEKAREAILKIERRIEEALAGETLRGLPDLGDRVYGLRVGVEGSMNARLPQARAVLVVDARGRLVLASRHGGAAFVQHPPRSMVVASILDSYIRTVGEALRLHMASALVRRDCFVRIEALASRICSAIGPEKNPCVQRDDSPTAVVVHGVEP
jgi:hypothetical protein